MAVREAAVSFMELLIESKYPDRRADFSPVKVKNYRNTLHISTFKRRKAENMPPKCVWGRSVALYIDN